MKKTILWILLTLFLLPMISIANDTSKANEEKKEKIQYIYHTVKEGESVYSIAKLYHAEQDDIFKLNPGSKQKIWAGATLLIPSIVGGDNTSQEEDTLHIKEHLLEFIGEMDKISSINTSSLDDIKAIDKRISSLDTKWNVYYQAKQANIADNESLMELVSEFQQLKQDTKDSLDANKHRFQQIQQFNKADKFISSQIEVYLQLTKKAAMLSLAETTASQLEALKNNEQLIFADIEKNYEIAKNAAAQDNSLTKRMQQITKNFVELKSHSEEIQAAEYKPLFERIKDYLYGIAAVALILMFVNMVQAKIKAIKQAKEAAKKLEEFKRKNDTEYPSI